MGPPVRLSYRSKGNIDAIKSPDKNKAINRIFNRRLLVLVGFIVIFMASPIIKKVGYPPPFLYFSRAINYALILVGLVP